MTSSKKGIEAEHKRMSLKWSSRERRERGGKMRGEDTGREGVGGQEKMDVEILGTEITAVMEHILGAQRQ